LKDAAVDIATSLKADDALLTKLWPYILRDRGIAFHNSGGSAEREVFLRDLAGLAPGIVKGPKAAKSRWFSWLHAASFWDKHWHTRLLLVLYVGIRKGWAKNLADIWGPASKGGKKPVEGARGENKPAASLVPYSGKGPQQPRSQLQLDPGANSTATS
jgi:hypothetical protein